MHSEYKFCPRCAGDLQVRFTEGRNRLVCERCGFIFYQNPVPAVAVILQQNGEILLVKRKYEPCAGMWSLPAGFIEISESPERCAVREVKEETNLDVDVEGLFGVYSSVDDPRSQVIVVVYRGLINGGELRSGDDALEAQFFDFERLPKNIAFASHRQVLAALRQERIK